MKILVTGATGFIGSALCARLLADHHEVTGLVRSPSVQNFSTLVLKDLSLIMPEHLKGYELVVHAAGLAHQEDENTNLFHQVNVLGTQTLAEACIKAGVGQLIHISSTKAIGEGSVGPDSIANPQSPYGQSKWDAEILLEDLRNKTDMKITILRIPLVFGSGVKGHFPTLIKLARIPLPLPYSALRARRSYLYLENLLDFIVYCFGEKDWANKNLFVADKDMISLGDILSSLSKAQGKTTLNLPLPSTLVKACAKLLLPKTRFRQLFIDCKTDISQTTSMTGWQPPYTTTEGIFDLFQRP